MTDRHVGASFRRTLPDGSYVVVYPLAYGRARLYRSESEDDDFVSDAYCYPSPSQAVQAAKDWDGEGDAPEGWERHMQSGRRRPGGDPAKETVRW